MGCHISYSEEGPGRAAAPPSPLLAVPNVTNVTARPSTASVPITVLLYNGPLLCGFNVAIKGLKHSLSAHLMPVKLLLFTFYLNGGLHAVSIGKPSEQMSNYLDGLVF